VTNLHIPDPLRDEIAGHIAAADGCEVFFTATTDDSGVLVTVQAVARGHATATPAVTRGLQAGQVVLHNHPSGDLTPSDPDIDIASRLGDLGIGFLIVNNQVTDWITVTRPHHPQPVEALAPDWIESFFAADGRLATTFAAYEPRPPQVAMATAFGEVINAGRPRLIEAGTGTGKSLAYLAPAARWAVANKKRVVVATHTIHLQQQLVAKDIPQLAKALDFPVTAVLVKGRRNYLCRRKLADVAAQADLFDDDEARALRDLADWARTTRDGSLADLPQPPSAAVWDRVASDADSTLRARCPHYDECFFYRARRRAAAANILVANHALLASDLAVRLASGDHESAAVLPPFDRVVIDEAHHLEESAVRHFGSQVSRLGILRILGRLHRDKGFHLLGQLQRSLAALPPFDEQGALLEQVRDALPQAVAEQRDAQRGGFDDLHYLLCAGGNPDTVDLDGPAVTAQRPALDQLLKILAAGLDQLARQIHQLLRRVGGLPPTLVDGLAAAMTDLAGGVSRLQLAAEHLLTCVGERPDNRVRWAEGHRAGRAPNLTLYCVPVELRGELREALFRPYPGTLLTSATLSTGNGCEFVADRLGLAQGKTDSEEPQEPEPLPSLVLPSPFDYPAQLRVCCPTDLPSVNDPRFDAAAAPLLGELATRHGGRMLVLTTSFRQVRALAAFLEPDLAAHGITVLTHGSADRHHLLEQFRSDAGFVLIATDSFWEGIDVVGPALSTVVVTRLPFRVPDTPLEVARADALRARGRDPFVHYSVPVAVLKLRQGIGRLIRSRTDRGEAWILDHRLLTKGYGRRFRAALPVKVEAGTTAELLTNVAR
jgi:ATP-dependent DNA helicase DinG